MRYPTLNPTISPAIRATTAGGAASANQSSPYQITDITSPNTINVTARQKNTAVGLNVGFLFERTRRHPKPLTQRQEAAR